MTYTLIAPNKWQEGNRNFCGTDRGELHEDLGQPLRQEAQAQVQDRVRALMRCRDSAASQGPSPL